MIDKISFTIIHVTIFILIYHKIPVVLEEIVRVAIMIYFRHPWVKVFYWIIAEVILNFIGLDDWADYSEFILNKRAVFSEVAIVEQKNNTHQPINSISALTTTDINISPDIWG